MARTAAGTQLTEAHRAAQLAIRAGSLRDLVTLWRAVDVTDLRGTIEVFSRAAAILAGQGYDQSGAIAARYYQLFRRVEGIAGVAPAPALAGRPPTAALAGDLRGAALRGIILARRGGMSVEKAGQTGFIRAAGALGKLVLNGGRRTLITTVARDKEALGFARVTSGDPCAFCRMLASRGPTYKTERSADFQTHDDCACTVETIYRGDKPLPAAEEYARQWQEAQSKARNDGTSSSGTANNALNNYRRYLAGEATASPSPATEESG